MAHFAEIDHNNLVVRVLVVDNELEDRGADYLANDLGLGGTWIQTSYNNTFRGRFASVNFSYNADADVFIAPQPYKSWSLNDDYAWQPPVAMPEQGNWSWNEEIGNWVEALA